MDNSVIIKGNKHGLSVIFDKNLQFEDLKRSVEERFESSASFFGNAKMAISFEGRQLTDEEEKELLEIITSVTSLEIICIVSEDAVKDARFQAAINEIEASDVKDSTDKSSGTCEQDMFEIEEDMTSADKNQNMAENISNEMLLSIDYNNCVFHKGTIRSGQVLEAQGSVIFMGDVNPGGKIVAGGNIIILGSLKGYVYAGCSGNEDCFVVALEMNPMQVQIGEVIARSSDSVKTPAKKIREIKPQVAYVDDDSIYIEELCQEVIDDIRI